MAAVIAGPLVPLRRRRFVRRAVRAARWVLMSVATTVVCLALLALVTGHQVVAVTSGSMRPGIEPGDALVVKESGSAGVAVGDIVIFHSPASTALIAHRVVEVTTMNSQTLYRMKGDANPVSDAALIPARNIHGKVSGRIPALGRELYWFSRVGLKLALATLFGFVFIEELVILLPYLKRRRAKRAAAAQAGLR